MYSLFVQNNLDLVLNFHFKPNRTHEYPFGTVRGEKHKYNRIKPSVSDTLQGTWTHSIKLESRRSVSDTNVSAVRSHSRVATRDSSGHATKIADFRKSLHQLGPQCNNPTMALSPQSPLIPQSSSLLSAWQRHFPRISVSSLSPLITRVHRSCDPPYPFNHHHPSHTHV
jgi:hypothetical protein